jgi:hypothetical protein
VTLQTVAILVTLAVKNGPPGMWRSLGSPSSAEPIGRLVTSPLWLAAGTAIYLVLAVVVLRRARRRTAPSARALLLTTAVLGLLVVAEWLTRSAVLGLLVPVLTAGAWIAVLLSVDRRRDSPDARRPDARHAAEVVDLAHWREGKQARRRAGSR